MINYHWKKWTHFLIFGLGQGKHYYAEEDEKWGTLLTLGRRPVQGQ